MHLMDSTGWIAAVIALGFLFYAELRAERQSNFMSAALVALKPSIQGNNKDFIISAINDLLGTLKK